jgi:nucleoside-diphosphate kinase
MARVVAESAARCKRLAVRLALVEIELRALADGALAARKPHRYKPRNTHNPNNPGYLSDHVQRRTKFMAVERTFSILKPDATARNLTGAINAMIEQAGLRIVGQKRVRISKEQAEKFYAVHKERPFYRELVEFMISGPVVVQVLEGEGAIAKYREVMGATDPAKADAGTIRKAHGTNVGENAVHGSDKPETAAREIGYFFGGYEV